MAPEYELGATFLPGNDDYYMPAEMADITSSVPQKDTSALTAEVEKGCALLELTGRDIQAPSTGKSSPFPTLHNRPPNVPPTYAEQESILERKRPAVLASSEPEAQLSWAEDALSYVENCAFYKHHVAAADGLSSLPGTAIEHLMRTDAMNIVSFLSEQGHPKAEFIKGTWFEFGKFGHAQSKPEAFRAYKRAAAGGFARAEYHMGLQYESTHEPMRALQHYKTGESLGDSASCYRLGMMHLLGQLGQSQDSAAGLRLIRHAADTADENAPHGAYVYGMLLIGALPQITLPDGLLPFDEVLSRKYLEKAALLRFAKAQLKMGAAYELCSLGCTFDPTLALHYMSLAARQGEPEAEMSISKWFLCGYEGQFRRDEEVAYTYARRAAVGDLHTAQFALGYFNEVGIHVPVDMRKAWEWYERASKNGNADASRRLEALSAVRPISLLRTDHDRIALHRIRSQYSSRRGPELDKHAQQSRATGPSTRPMVPTDRTTTPYPGDGGTASPVNRKAAATPYPLGEMLAQKDGPSMSAPPGRTRAQHPPRSTPQPHQHPPPADPKYPFHTAAANKPDLRQVSAGSSPPPDPAVFQSANPPARPETTTPGLAPRLDRQPKMPDIGFSAPVDPRADYHNRPRAAARPMASDARAPTPQYAHVAPPKPDTPRPPADKDRSRTGPQGRDAKSVEATGVPAAKTEHDCVVM